MLNEHFTKGMESLLRAQSVLLLAKKSKESELHRNYALDAVSRELEDAMDEFFRESLAHERQVNRLENCHREGD